MYIINPGLAVSFIRCYAIILHIHEALCAQYRNWSSWFKQKLTVRTYNEYHCVDKVMVIIRICNRLCWRCPSALWHWMPYRFRRTQMQFSSLSSWVNILRMMEPSNGNIFRVTGHLWRECTGHRWIPLTDASDAELWCFLWPAPV